MHEQSFKTVADALLALRHFDPMLANNWEVLLADPAAMEGCASNLTAPAQALSSTPDITVPRLRPKAEDHITSCPRRAG